MKFITKNKFQIPRIILGSVFIISGLNGFLNFIPDPEFSPAGSAFISNMKESGFFWPLLKLAELAGGIFLLFSSLGQLGVLVLAPITTGIVLFHMALNPDGTWLAISLFVLEVILIVVYWKNFQNMFSGTKNSLSQTRERRDTQDRVASDLPRNVTL